MTSPSLFCLALLLAMTVHLRADYVFYPGLDSQGGDMGPSQAKTRKQMETYCNILGTCQGFNTRDRAPKGVLKPVPQWTHWTDQPLEGFYRRISDYTFIQGADSQGGDLTSIPNQTPAQLKVCCDETAGCVGFNTKGQVKSSIVEESQWTHWSDNPSDGLWIKTTEIQRLQSTPATQNTSSASPDLPQAPPGYVYYDKLDSESGDIASYSGLSVDELKAKCDEDVRCVSFNTNGKLRGGKVLERAFWKPLDGGFYAKQNPLVVQNPTTDQFVEYSQVDLSSVPPYTLFWDIIGSLSEIQAQCSSDPTCLAYTENGNYYNYIIPQSDWGKGYDTVYLRMNPPLDGINTSTYTYYEGFDAESLQINKIPDYSIDQLKVACDADIRCVSFNTDGIIRGGKVLDRTKWTPRDSGGFYVKSNPAVVTDPTKIMFEFADDYYFNVPSYKKIEVNNSDDAFNACKSDPECLAVSGEGELYNEIPPQSEWVFNMRFSVYVRMNPPNPYQVLLQAQSTLRPQKVSQRVLSA